MSINRNRQAALILGALLTLAGGQRLWNAWDLPPLTGYDAPGHAGYMFTLIKTAELPHPHDGWSTFHPPLYYIFGARVWGLLEPWGPRAVVAGIRAIGALAGLAAGAAAFLLLRQLRYGIAITGVATALLLFVPVSQLSAVMIGNEAFAAAWVALALGATVQLHAAPRERSWATAAGLLAGLAIAAKFTGVLALVGCALPYARALVNRRTRDRGLLISAALCFGIATLVGGPTYLRNFAVTGTPLPTTFQLEPMKSIEAQLVIRPRRLHDFLTLPPGAVLRPSLYHVAERQGDYRNRNPAMTSVWGLTYAGAWSDVFAHRTRPIVLQQDGTWYAPTLGLLGLVPTLLLVAGFGAALMALVRTRAGAPDAPLTATALLGLLFYIVLLVAKPSAAAVKCSYLLGLALPASVFFARGVALLPRPLAFAALLLSSAAAVVAALVFTSDLFFPPREMFSVWPSFAERLPKSYILEAIHALGIATE